MPRMPRINPTVGRVVHYYPPHPPSSPKEPLAAIIAHVIDNDCVNLLVIERDGTTEPRTAVFLVQGDETPGGSNCGYCTWMPYQLGQAARTEQAEKVEKAATCATRLETAPTTPPYRVERGAKEWLDFGRALDALHRGELLQRRGWNGAGMFIFLVPGSTFSVNRPPLLGIFPEGHSISYRAHIDMKTADGTVVPWVASHSDLLARDWRVLDFAGRLIAGIPEGAIGAGQVSGSAQSTLDAMKSTS